MMTFQEIGRILNTSSKELERRTALKTVADWWVNQCLLFGVKPEIAYRTAAIIVDGLDLEFRPDD